MRAARLRRGLTQEQLAEAVGMSQRWVSNLELGGVDMPRRQAMEQLADVLDIPLADLYIAAQMARTRTEATRITEEIPPYDALAPDTRRALEIIEALTPDRRRSWLSLGNMLLKEQTGKPRRSRGRSEREAG